MRPLPVVALLALVACGPRSTASLSLPSLPPPVGGTSFAPLGDALVAAIASGQKPRAEAKPAPPIALAAADGGELTLAAIDVATVVTGPIALTELHLTFHNPEARQREGRFAITLPADAAVSRFAMKNATWLEAEVVPRQQARRVYETYLKARVDPALLEQDAGNTFSARVFPIEASADKELIIGYSHTVASGDGGRVALAGLPAVGALRWSITIDGTTQTGSLRDRAPSDLVIAGGGAASAVGAGDRFVARVTPPVPVDPDPLDAATILIDTSASRASLLRRQADVVTALVAAIARRDPSTPIALVAFDQDTEVLARGPASRVTDGLAARLSARGGLGASDLGAALASIGGATRVVLVSDGIATIGERDSGALAAQIRAAGIGRLDAITVGAMLDRDRLMALTGAAARPGAIVDGDGDGVGQGSHVLAALETRRLDILAIHVEGATTTWPTIVRGAGAGEAIIVAGRRPARAAGQPLAIRFGDGASARTVEVAVTAAPAPLVRRAATRLELTELDRTLALATSPAARAATRAAITRLGVAQRLVTSQTSLLVLESDADYARFCIRRDARADLLTIGKGVVQVIDRSPGGAATSAPCPVSTATTTVTVRDELGEIADDAPPPAAPDLTHTGSFGGSTSVDSIYVVDGRGPTIDATSTSQGLTITLDYKRNLPASGRTFEATLGAAAGRQDSLERAAVAAIGPRGAHPPVTVVPDPPTASWSRPPARAPLSPYQGRLLSVMTAVRDHHPAVALREALAWYVDEPTELAAMIALGEALEARGAGALAARAYGSILDRFPGRVELVRFAGERLERLGPSTRARVLDVYALALADRPDQVSGYRLLAMAQLADGRYADAVTTLERGLARARRDSIADIYRRDLGLVGAAWIARHPTERDHIVSRLGERDATIPTGPSVRFILSWETDTNDVDLHVRDASGEEAYYAHRELRSGGRLLDDVTTGYGPEEFRIDGKADGGPYRLSVAYFSRGPMGLGLGTVQIVRHDGAGHVTVEARPFVLQTEQSEIDLGATR